MSNARLTLVLLAALYLSGCEAASRPTVYAFTATWCKQCQLDKPALARLPCEVVYLDVDSQTHWEVGAIPLYIVLRGGKEVYRTRDVQNLTRMFK